VSTIRKIAASTSVPPDLAEKIGTSGINEILLVLWESYHNLKNDASVVIAVTSEEDDITQELFLKISQVWDSRNRAISLVLNNLIPVHQYADSLMKKKKGRKSPTIDFCFKDRYEENSYFGAEAKNLYAGRSERIRRYVETGVGNFISGKYGSYSSVSSVIGYVLSGEIPDIVVELKKEIQKGFPTSNLSRTTSSLDPQYVTKHIRTYDDKEITLYHLFFSFIE
jgi:hypothetical protein